jgi:hypothetical protein
MNAVGRENAIVSRRKQEVRSMGGLVGKNFAHRDIFFAVLWKNALR